MTNADKFRSMTDEKIVDLMLKCMVDCAICPCYDITKDDCAGDGSCQEQLMNWLKQEE